MNKVFTTAYVLLIAAFLLLGPGVSAQSTVAEKRWTHPHAPLSKWSGLRPDLRPAAHRQHGHDALADAPKPMRRAGFGRAVSAREGGEGINAFRGGGYCLASAEGSTDFALDERIVGVSFANINNTSPDVAPTPPAYTFYPSPVANVERGGTYSISIDVARAGASNSYSENQVLVWIDYDQDQDFTGPGEQVLVSAIGSVEAYTGNITIPPTANLGNTRMRVRLIDTHDGSAYINVFNDTPCGVASYGEIEDHTVNIGEASGSTPSNDDCSSVIPEPLAVGGSITFNGDNTGATIDGDYVPGSALSGAGLPSVWHAFTIDACADVTLRYCGTTPAFLDYWVVLATGCPADAVIFNTSFNSDDCGDGNGTILYEDLPAGTYYVPVMLSTDVTFPAQGPYTLEVSAVACGGGTGPANDLCSNVVPTPLAVGGSITFNGDNTGATIDGDYVPGSDLDVEGLPSVWHAFTIADCADVTVNYCGTTPEFLNFWIVLATQCPADALVFSTSFDLTDCGDGNATINYQGLEAGTYYLPVMLDTDPATLAQGPYTIDVSAVPCPAPPANDVCTGAFPLAVDLACEPTTGTVAGATESLPAVDCNGFQGVADDDVWYSFIATSPSATITVVGGASFDLVVELFEGACGALTSVDCADATLDGGTEEIAATGLVPGSTYFVRVYHWFLGYPDTPTFDICVVGDVGTAMAENAAGAMHLRPNPTQGDVMFDIPKGIQVRSVEFTDMTGRLVHTEALNTASAGPISLDLSGKLAPGTYCVRLIATKGILAERLIVR